MFNFPLNISSVEIIQYYNFHIIPNVVFMEFHILIIAMILIIIIQMLNSICFVHTILFVDLLTDIFWKKKGINYYSTKILKFVKIILL